MGYDKKPTGRSSSHDHHHAPSTWTAREGRIAYDVTGSGPLVVAVPGMGDLRSSYRHLAPALVAAGFRVATMDLRGHGDSDTTFAAYDDPAAASDVIALIEHLGGPALVIGNSMGAAAAVIAAAENPIAGQWSGAGRPVRPERAGAGLAAVDCSGP